MTTLREAAQQALEALKMMRDTYEEYACPACDHADAAIYALKTALAEPVQATWCDTHQHYKWCEHNGGVEGTTGWEKP